MPAGAPATQAPTDDVRSGDLTPLFDTIVAMSRGRGSSADRSGFAALLDRDRSSVRPLPAASRAPIDHDMPIKALDVNSDVVEEEAYDQVFHLSAAFQRMTSTAPKQESSPVPA